MGDPVTESLVGAYVLMGQPLFKFSEPTGYPDAMEPWQATNSRVGSWRFLNSLVVQDLGGQFLLDGLGQTPVDVRSANELADFWIDRILGRSISTEDRGEIVDFMAQGIDPAFNLPLDTDTSVQDRLRAMVGLILMAPEFLWR